MDNEIHPACVDCDGKIYHRGDIFVDLVTSDKLHVVCDIMYMGTDKIPMILDEGQEDGVESGQFLHIACRTRRIEKKSTSDRLIKKYNPKYQQLQSDDKPDLTTREGRKAIRQAARAARQAARSS